MNGFANHGLDEDAFGEKTGNIVQAFDYFRMLILLDHWKEQHIYATSNFIC